MSTPTIWEYVEPEDLSWKRQQSWFHEAEEHNECFAEKGDHHRSLHSAAPPNTGDLRPRTRLPLDEDLPGAEWKREPQRTTVESDDGRRGTCWVHGAFEPATGEAAMVITDRRDSPSHILLLEQMIESFPSDRWLVIEDNLSMHHSRGTQVALLAWPEI